jgi:hypothetical protein
MLAVTQGICSVFAQESQFKNPRNHYLSQADQTTTVVGMVVNNPKVPVDFFKEGLDYLKKPQITPIFHMVNLNQDDSKSLQNLL